MHSASYLRDLEPWYLVGLKDQEKDKKVSTEYQKKLFFQRKEERVINVVKHLGIDPSKISFIEHHLAHLAAAYYTANNITPNKPILGFTCDGAGDGLSATVSICKNESA